MEPNTTNGLPHKDVCVRLMPSTLQGVGVFAICNIKKWAGIFPYGNKEKIIWLDRKQVKRYRGYIRELYDCYGAPMGSKIGVPFSFSHISIPWYMNHSFKPNAYVDQDYNVVAARNIKKGEEITIDYTTFTDMKIPSSWK